MDRRARNLTVGCLLLLAALTGPLAAADGPALPFAKSLAGGQELPLPFGVGLTVYG
jgi:hypothetical protein